MDVDFRDMMASFPTGVSVVTAQERDAAPWGMTCSALCSVSVSPASLLVCLRSASPTLRAVAGSGAFAINLLHGEAQWVASLFASGAPDRFDRVSWRPTAHTRSPALIEAAHSIAECTVDGMHPAGDHVIVVGMVRAVERFHVDSALLYAHRSYGQWPRAAVPMAGVAQAMQE